MLESISTLIVLAALLLSYYNLCDFGKKLSIGRKWCDNDLLILEEIVGAILKKDDKRLGELLEKKRIADAAFFDAMLRGPFAFKFHRKRIDV